MGNLPSLRCTLAAVSLLFSIGISAPAQTPAEDQYGPVVRGYLGYLKQEQEVVDDRVSRREVNAAYYRRNSNRIRALRQMAIRLADETHNDYLPELEAVASDEFGLLFEQRPRMHTMRVGEVYDSTFRYLGVVRSGEVFFVFARLDPYEQADLREALSVSPARPDVPTGSKVGVRARRVTNP